MNNLSLDWLQSIRGWLGTDIYSTAWVALVPEAGDPARPAWPEALAHLRFSQLDDGSWGEPGVTYAHGRTIATLAAIWALHTWHDDPGDATRIEQGLQALRRYGEALAAEPHEPIGFELLLPRLRGNLQAFEARLPLECWAPIQAKSAEKLALIDHLKPEPGRQQTWWFSMEMLSDDQLAALDDSLLDAHGAIATSTAATAAYLRAQRLAGKDSPRAAQFLARMLKVGHGGVPVGWPFDVFERIWVLDSFMRIGLNPAQPAIQSLARSVWDSWHLNTPGLAYSDTFMVNDGDDTLVGFAALNWAGLSPDDDAILRFWAGDHFRSYVDERTSSVSVNLHALLALRLQPGFPHRALAERAAAWLMARMKPDGLFDDKWHLSPYYSVAHAIPAFEGWDDYLACAYIDYLLNQQQADGGWGYFGRSTLEETGHCVIGLYHAASAGLLDDLAPLRRAAGFFEAHAGQPARERLWIGKTLYRPESIVRSTVQAAYMALRRLQCDVRAPETSPAWQPRAASAGSTS